MEEIHPKNRVLYFCGIKTGLFYKLLVTRLSEVKWNTCLCKSKWKRTGETTCSCSFLSTPNPKHIYLYRF